MADEAFLEPALELARVRDMTNVSSEAFFTMGHGETVSVGCVPTCDLATVRSDLYGLYLDSLRSNPVVLSN